MQLSLTSAILFATGVAGAAVAADRCHSHGLIDYLPLSTYLLAKSWCGQHHPCTVTSTTKVTKTRTRTASPIVTVTGTSTITQTVATVTSFDTSVATTTTFTSTAYSTTTTCTRPTNVKRHEQIPAVTLLAERTSPPHPSDLLARLKKQPYQTCDTVCKCNGFCQTLVVTSTCTEYATTTGRISTAALTTIAVTATTTAPTVTTTTVSTNTTSLVAVQSCAATQAASCADGTQPQSCDQSAYCTSGCYCGSNTDGDSACMQQDNYAVDCELSACDINADCPSGQTCITNTCCNNNVCVSTDNGATLCDNAAAPRKLFRARGKLEKLQKKTSSEALERIATVLPPRPTS